MVCYARGGRCHGTVLIGGTGSSRKLYAESGSCSAQGHQIGPGIDTKEEAKVAGESSQRSRCLVWVKSVSPRTKNERKPAWRQRRTARSMKLAGQFMRGAVAAAIDQVQRLLGVGQRDQQGMIAPGRW